MQGKAVIISAPSGAGKTTIVRHLLNNTNLPLEFSISACSRDPRGQEKEGVDYYYLGVEGFKKAINENAFLEWEEVYADQFYGTLNKEVQRIWDKGKVVIFDVDVVGGLNLKQKLADQALSIFIKAPDLKTLEQRLRGRATESNEKIQMRLSKAKEEIERADQFDTIIVNDNLDTALKATTKAVSDFINQ